MASKNPSTNLAAHERDELHFNDASEAFPADDNGNAALRTNGSASHSHDDNASAQWTPTQNGTASGNVNINGTADGSQVRARRNVFNEAANLVNAGGLGHAQPSSNAPPPTSNEISSALAAYERAFLPHQPKSLSGIALRSFLLGLVLSASSILSLYLAYNQNTLWRAPFFLSSLCVFHFLEFYTTALTNTASAKVSSFLLASNGSAYTIAHTAAITECLLSHFFLPASILPNATHYIILAFAFVFIAVGQTIRAIAMLQAGSNFSHMVAHTKRQEHQLVIDGLYSVLRHPSYFGYFWWAIGTQLACGNAVCLVGYAFVLYRFFERRISGEEELLVRFFGQEYVKFRERTWVGIPGIR
jgi:protein-S-isoprenylcysteine O-methyltransferase